MVAAVVAIALLARAAGARTSTMRDLRNGLAAVASISMVVTAVVHLAPRLARAAHEILDAVRDQRQYLVYAALLVSRPSAATWLPTWREGAVATDQCSS